MNMYADLLSQPDVWEHTRNSGKPVFLYGMGNGADKVLQELKKRRIAVEGVFANNEFVRGQSYQGFRVKRLDELKKEYGEIIALLCFGSHRDEVIRQILCVADQTEMLAPDVPVAGDTVFDRAYLKSHAPEYDRLRELLADDLSRLVLDHAIAYKLTGSIGELLKDTTEEPDNWKLLQLNDHEDYLDLGAYTGDTAALFRSMTNGWSSVTAVEPDDRNFRKLSESLSGIPNVELHHIGIGDRWEQRQFRQGSGRGSGKGEGALLTYDSVDNIMLGKRVSFLKMDVEGQEAAALTGAEKTIRRHHPKVLISAYHRTEDLHELPFRLLTLRKDYHLYLRRSRCLPAWELNYYAVPCTEDPAE